jgi:hypothetical protein
MSLVRIALRIAAVEALRGNTEVGENVLDSPNGALDIQSNGALRSDEDKPFISIFTDTGKTDKIEGRSLTGNGQCDVVFESGISAAMLERNPDTGAQEIVGYGIPASDRGFEFHLDIVKRQIADTLLDPSNEWAQIFLSLTHRFVRSEFAARRTTDNQRLAGHQFRLTVEAMDDPIRGEAIDPLTPFGRFLSKIEASGDEFYGKQATFIRTMLAGSNEPWQVTQTRRGLTSSELLALGLGPVAGDVDRLTPAMTTGRIDSNGEPVEVIP